MWTTLVFILITLVVFAVLYVLFIRPMILKWQALAGFWQAEASAWTKVQAFFAGMKIKLLARLMWVPTAFVAAYDKFTTVCTSCDLTPIKAMLPAWSQDYLPLLGALAIPILIDIARSYSSARPAA